MKLEKFQFWTDVAMIVLTCMNTLYSAITGNLQAALGWFCAAITSVNALLSHRQTRHWWSKYCRAMGWEDEKKREDEKKGKDS